MLLTSVTPHAAVSHEICQWVRHIKIRNLLGISALVSPADEADKVGAHVRADPAVLSHSPRSDLDRWDWLSCDSVPIAGMTIRTISRQELNEGKLVEARGPVDDMIGGRLASERYIAHIQVILGAGTTRQRKRPPVFRPGRETGARIASWHLSHVVKAATSPCF